MAPTKPSSNAKAVSAGPTSARSYRRQPQAQFKRGDDETDSSADTPEKGARAPSFGIGSRQDDFSERSWWMVDIDSSDGDSTQGATALVKRCMRAYGWNLPQTRKILSAYKQFLHLKKTLGDWDATLLSPCHFVDLMWHQHILDNFNYYHDMMLLCGHFVGHNPDGALDTEAKGKRDRFTKECLLQHFGDSYDEVVWEGGSLAVGSAIRNQAVGQHEQGNANGDQKITIRVKCQTGEGTSYKIKRSTRMSTVFDTFAERMGVCADSLRFTLDAERVGPDETPETLDLEEDDQIDVFLEQGGC